MRNLYRVIRNDPFGFLPIKSTDDGFHYTITDDGEVPFSGRVIMNDGGEGLVEYNVVGGSIEGLMIGWYSDKKYRKQFEANYKNGHKHGSYLYWHDNGQLEIEGEYFHGKKAGMWKNWDSEGNLLNQVDHE